MQDGQRVATTEARNVRCLAASNNGKWIAGGIFYGEVFVWDAETYKTVWKNGNRSNQKVSFSPDSTKLVTLGTGTATVWEIPHGKQTQTLNHRYAHSAIFSPSGEHIATASSHDGIRVWDSQEGRLIVEISVKVTSYYNKGLVWFNDHFFVASSKHGEFIACSSNRTVTLWSTSTHSQLGLVEHSQDISSIAFSPDNRFLAIGGATGKIALKSLSRFTVSAMSRWISTLNNSLASLVFSNRIPSRCLVCTPPSRNQTFRSTTPRSTHGSTASSKTQSRY